MNAVTYSQIQELVQQLPAIKLPLAYNLLTDLAKKEVDEQASPSDFMLLPLSERRRIMAQQALQMITHYEQTQAERQAGKAETFPNHPPYMQHPSKPISAN